MSGDKNDIDSQRFDRRKLMKTLGVSSVFLAGCSGNGGGDGGDGGGGGTPTPTPSGGDGGGGGTPTPTPSGGDGGGGGMPSEPKAFFQQASKGLEGTTINLVTESTPASLFYEKQVPQFEEWTGIKVNFNATAWGEMYNKEVSAAVSGSGAVDIGYVEQDALAAFALKGWLVDLTKFRQNNPDLAMPGFNVDGFVPFAQNFRYPNADSGLKAYPMESFLKVLTYRQDVYDELGLSVPKSPQEYMQNVKKIDEQMDMAGHASQFKGITGPYAIVESYWPLFGVYNWGINLNKWTALASRGGMMNSEAAARGLKFFKDLLNYAPEGVRSYTWSGTPDAISAGKAAQGLVYSENFGNMVTADSPFDVTNLQAEIPPVKPSVREAAKPGGDYGYVGYFDGGGFGILKSSRKKKAAYLFIQHLTRPKMSDKMAETTGALVRSDSLKTVKDGKINNATGYIDLYQDKADWFQGNPVGEVQKAIIEGPINTNFHKYMAGDISDAQTAVNQMAWETEQQLSAMGFLGSTLSEKPF